MLSQTSSVKLNSGEYGGRKTNAIFLDISRDLPLSKVQLSKNLGIIIGEFT